MNILFLANWKIQFLDSDNNSIQPANKVVRNKAYWFFESWPNEYNVDVLDYSTIWGLHSIERNLLKIHIVQNLKAFFKKKKYDLIITHGAPSGVLLAFMNMFFGKNAPSHIVVDVGCFNGARNNRLETPLIRFASKSLAGIIYHAKIQKDYYKEHLPHLLDKSRYVPFGVDLGYFYPQKKGEDQIEDYVITYGYSKRDYPTLLRAWNSISANTRLKIVGVKDMRVFGVNKNEQLRNVDILPIVPTAKLKRLISRSKFVVLPLPYYKYAYGQKTLLEAMALEKAVIVTKTPSTEDYVTDKKTGVFVKPYNHKDLAEKIKYLLEKPEIANKIGRQAAKSVTNDFSAKTMSRMIYEAVKDFRNH